MTGSGSHVDDLLSLGGGTVLVLMFCAYFLALEAILLSLAQRSAYRSQLKRRLAMESGPPEQKLAIARMRQKPLISGLPLGWLNRLLVQSGVSWGGATFPTILMGVSTLMALPLLYLSGSLAFAAAGGLAGGTLALLLSLKSMRDRRYRKLETQLPDAADVLVRSLKAGHPIVSSIRLVARELPDPIGTILDGSTLPKLLGGDPMHVVGFAWDGKAWHQIPVQVDQRDYVSPGQIYDLPASS